MTDGSTPRKKVGVLISGRGSNLQALIDAGRDPDYPAEIAVVLSNRPQAAGLQRAADAGIETLAIDHKAFADRESFDARMTEELERHGVELVAIEHKPVAAAADPSVLDRLEEEVDWVLIGSAD